MKNLYYVGLIFFCLFILSRQVYAIDLPLRKEAEFKELKYIDTAELFKNKQQYHIIDVRSTVEFNVIHIYGAVNANITTMSFLETLKRMQNTQEKKDFVFYCNGENCPKSYEAGLIANKNGFTNSYVYDAGIFHWARAHPEQTVLNEKIPADLALLPTKSEMDMRTLTFEKFKEKLNDSKNPMLVDIREEAFRSYFPKLDKKVLVRSIKMGNFVNQVIKQENYKDKEFFIFDSVEKQAIFIDMFFKHDVYKRTFWFLKGGVDSLNEENKVPNLEK